jgi:hypothetical protein
MQQSATIKRGVEYAFSTAPLPPAFFESIIDDPIEAEKEADDVNLRRYIAGLSGRD